MRFEPNTFLEDDYVVIYKAEPNKLGNQFLKGLGEQSIVQSIIQHSVVIGDSPGYVLLSDEALFAREAVLQISYDQLSLYGSIDSGLAGLRPVAQVDNAGIIDRAGLCDGEKCAGLLPL